VKVLGELVHLAPLQARAEQLALKTGWSSMPVVLAVPDERRESRLVLVTEPSEESHALMAAFNAVTEPLCHLDRVVEVESIPRSDLGKVEQAALLKLVIQA